jgi:D-3-phosphoglycerate dehydrogenase
MFRVKILSYKAPLDTPVLAWLRENDCEVVVDPGWPGMSEDELIAHVDGFDGVCCGVEPFTRKVIAASPRLKSIARTGVGFNSIDLEAAEDYGVIVTTTPGANRHAVADHTLGFMIMLAHRIPANQQMVANQKWTRVVGKDVYRKTVGIIGVGAIGKEVAKRAAGFNMNLLGFDILRDYTFGAEVGLRYVNLHELMSQSDFITLHVPYYELTHHMIGEAELNLVKPTSYLINTARGGVVDEAALYNVLTNGKMAGAALDVAENEPNFASPLMKLENVIWTPHVAGITDESRLACLEGACRNTLAILTGHGEFHQVKPGAIG